MNTNGAPIIVSRATSVGHTITSMLVSGAFSGNMVYTSRRSIIIISSICSTMHRHFTARNNCLLRNGRLGTIRSIVLGGNTLGTTVINRPTCGVTRLTNFSMPRGAGVLVNRIAIISRDRPFTRRGLSPALTVCHTGSFRSTMRGTRGLITVNNVNRASYLCASRSGRPTHISCFNRGVGATHVLVGAPTSRNNVNSLCGFGLTPSLALNYNS